MRWRSLSIENRAYLPAADLAQKLRDTQTPLFGVESQQALAEFDILLVSAQVPGVYVPQFYDSHPDGSVKPNHPEVPERILRRVATPIPAYSLA